MPSDKEFPTVSIKLASFVFADGRRKTIGSFFDDTNWWGLKIWRTTPELRAAWSRLSSLAWNTQGKVLALRTDDLKILCGFLATADLGGPDVRLLVQLVNQLQDALPEEPKGPTLETLDLSADADDTEPPPHSVAPPSSTNGATKQEETTHG